MRPLITLLLAGAMSVFAAVSAGALEMRVAVLRIDYTQTTPISRYDERPGDLGFAGAEVATEDNSTTGQFLGQTYVTETVAVPAPEAEAALDRIRADGVRVVAVLARGPDLLRLADRAGEGMLLLNAAARETDLRSENCRANLLHVTPSEAMLADAAVQFAAWKRWGRLALIRGSHPEDKRLADLYRRAAGKFGLRIVDEREIADTGGSRRTDTGHVLVQRQLPVDTQGLRGHDAVIAADNAGVFAPYLTYHLWDPRPVIGSAGLRPVSFHAAHEAWGATQFQRRFEALARRQAQEADYDTWLALRVVGEAVTRTGSTDPATLRSYMLSDKFELAAFKGQSVTFRAWNGQLRQPVLLYDGRITVSVSPQDGFLHQFTALDTLGLDAPESRCTAFAHDRS